MKKIAQNRTAAAKMLLQFAIVLISLHVGTAQRVVAVNQEGLREEFRRQVREVIEQTTTNVSRLHQLQCGIEGDTLRDEISEQTNTTLEFIAESNREHESTAEELKECIRKDLDAGLRKVNEGVETTVTQAVATAVSTAVKTAVQTTVAQAVDRAVTTAVDRAVTTAVDRAVTEVVNRVVPEAVDKAVTEAVDRAVNVTVDRTVNTAIDPIEQLLKSLLNDVALQRLLQLGHIPAIPASSCSEILAAVPSSPSGYYWLRAGNGSSIRVYCDMTRTCGGITGGWMQVANIDMTNSNQTCPHGLKTQTSPKRLCGINVSGAWRCSSATFATHGTKYTHICGKMIGYQYGLTTAFYDYYYHQFRTIDSFTVGGVSLSHGNNPRKHIWTFAAAGHEGTGNIDHSCPCSNPASNVVIPPWVGNDYFCDSGGGQQYQLIFYADDPLWDGEGCGPTSTCCSLNNPPWFSKQLPSPTTDDIEMRLCRVNYRRYEDTQVEKIELYVQ